MNPRMLTTQMKIMSVATYGNQRPIAFVGQALLGDLHLRDLVDRLAERLPAVRAATGTDAHEDDPDDDRDDRAEHEVGDRLVDRHVDRADLQVRPPGLEVPLLGRVELRLVALRPRARPTAASSASSAASGEEALHAFASPPKYVASPTPSSAVNAMA